MRHYVRGTVAASLVVAASLLAACGDDGSSVGPSVEPPANFSAQAQSSTTVEITFSAVTGATGYKLERAEGSGGTFTEVAQPTSSPFTDPALQPNTTYRYRIATVSGSETSAFTSEASVTTLAPGRQVVTVTQDISTNTTWVVDNVYRLQGFRKVASGATLTIQPGTRIEGDVGTVGSSLFVLRGARIVAIGTPASPIVFTSSQAVGTRQPGDWGGLIIVGNGIVNRGDPTNLEGTGTSADNPLINYAGSSNNADNSGTLQYVRVEFAGFGPAPDAELNSFTFAAVGSGTTMDHVQSLAGLDDAFEFFGGALDGKFLVSYESGTTTTTCPRVIRADCNTSSRSRPRSSLPVQGPVTSPRTPRASKTTGATAPTAPTGRIRIPSRRLWWRTSRSWARLLAWQSRPAAAAARCFAAEPVGTT